ncbi:type IV secretion system protein [Jannaschia sp. M317]|uniref:type IV secretion system protein n=1 Tax=Jannaschia sp. M317 TaxID=2867011 RepID=UPI0021A3B366|nr:type IV secretion system protein [Jannaschia sp. M317]UWQ19721.1 type IV secretion system protein [Jannaschia sp. M317]
MAVIEQILGLVDATVIGVAAQTYDGVLTAVRPVVAIASTLTVALVGANLVLQTVPLTVGTAVSLALRITLVNVFLVYGNITAVYLALTEAPGEIGAGMLSALSGATVTNLYDGLDDLYRTALEIGDAISESGGLIVGAMAGLLMFLVASIMATVAIIVLSAAKIMIAVLIAIAPAMVACTLFRQTAPIFEAWVKLALGMAFVPLLVAAMAGFTISAGAEVAPADMGGIETLSEALSFVVVMMLGAGLLVLVPSFAQSLAATNIAIGGIAADAAGLSRRAVGRGASATARLSAGTFEGARTGQPLRGPMAHYSNLAGRAGGLIGRGARAGAGSMAARMKKG